MRMLFVIDIFCPTLGGAEERTYQMCRNLQLAGVDVEILTTRYRLDYAAISRMPGCKVHTVRAFFFRFLFPFGARRWLRRNVARYDIVHISKNWVLLSYFAGAAAARQGVPYAFSTMGFIAIHNRSVTLKRIYRRFMSAPLVRNASACIAVTEEEKQDLVAFGARPEDVHVVPNGFVSEDFQFQANEKFRQRHQLGSRRIILFIGRMDPIKGVHLLIEAFAQRRQLLTDWVLVLVGTATPYREEMRSLAASLGIDKSVSFLDPIFGQEKSAAYHASEIVAIPSIKDAMTIIAIEAACCAKPVLITTTAHFPDLVQSGAGLEVEPTSAALAAGLAKLTDPACDRAAMGALGRTMAMERYEWKSVALRFKRVFEAAIAARRQHC